MCFDFVRVCHELQQSHAFFPLHLWSLKVRSRASLASGVLRIRWVGFTVLLNRPPVGVEEGNGGGGGVEGDEGGRQAPSKAPGQTALPWDHLQNP